MIDFTKLAARVEALTHESNEIDVLCEIALFQPSSLWSDIRANSAGTKVIYTDRSGKDRTYWACDWTGSEGAREETAETLRAKAREARPLVGDECPCPACRSDVAGLVPCRGGA